MNTSIPALSLSNVNKNFGDFQALKNINLRVERGEFFGLLGANGAGKTTILNTISSLTRPSSGEVKLFGYDLSKAPFECKHMLGVVPQEINLNQFERVLDTLITQAGYFGIRVKDAKPRALEILKALGLSDKKNVRIIELSGGMKRRVMIARALVHQPKLLLLDEPTAGVDVETRKEMWKFIQSINASGTAIILTTHYLEEAEQFCSRIAIVEKGAIIEDCPTAELLSRIPKRSIILELTKPIKQLPNIEGNQCQIIGLELKDPTTIVCNLEDNFSLSKIFAFFTAHDIDIKDMRSENNRLESFFLQRIAPNSQTS